MTTTVSESPTTSSAARTAPPVPSASGWITVSVPSGSPAERSRSGEAITQTRPAPASWAASTGQAIIGRPQIGCSTFGTDERIRVPSPAAIIKTVGPLTFGIVKRRQPAVRWRLDRRTGRPIRSGASLFASLRDLVLHTLLFPPVKTNPLADRIVGDAVLASHGHVARLLDFLDELLIWRTLDQAPVRLWDPERG